jgi:hypothetical protein
MMDVKGKKKENMKARCRWWQVDNYYSGILHGKHVEQDIYVEENDNIWTNKKK